MTPIDCGNTTHAVMLDSANPRQNLLPHGMIALCFLFGVLTRGINDCFPVFVPSVESEFAASRAAVTSIYGLTMLAVGFAGPLIGLLLDRLGPRVLAIVGVIATAAAGLLASQARELWHLHLAFGVGFGIGCASLGGIFQAAVLGRWFSARLGTALAVAWSANGVGVMVMAPLAEALIAQAGWRHAWLVLGAVTSLAIPITLLLPWRRIIAGSADYARRRNMATQARSFGPTVGEALRAWPFWGFFICFAGTSVSMYALMPQVVALLVARGFSPAAAARVLAITGVMMPLGMIGFNWLADRGGRTFSAAAAYSCTAAGICALWLVQSSDDIVAVGAFVVLLGSTMGSRGPMISTLATLRYRGAHLGKIYGLITCGMGVGAAIGAWGGGLLHDLTGGYGAVLGLSLVSLAIGAAPLVWEARQRETVVALR